MSLADLIRQMGAAGASAEVIALAVEFVHAQEAERKAAVAARKRKQRAQDPQVTECHATSRDIAGQAVTGRDPSQDKEGPPDPLRKLNPPGDISTREASAKRPGPADAQAFGEFWTAYPRKVAKPEALKAYGRALRRLGTPDAAATVLAGLRRHLPAWEETEPDLVPHPTTWLNQDRFHDTPTQPRSPQPRLIHDRDASRNDRRTAAHLERLQDVAAASEVAARAWRPPGGH